jgi:ATP-dependent RNA helicase DDX18/HAS1
MLLLSLHQVTLNEYEFPAHKVANVQSQLCRLVEKNYYLNKSAREAYRSYLLAYASHSLKQLYNVHELDLQVRYELLYTHLCLYDHGVLLL